MAGMPSYLFCWKRERFENSRLHSLLVQTLLDLFIFGGSNIFGWTNRNIFLFDELNIFMLPHHLLSIYSFDFQAVFNVYWRMFLDIENRYLIYGHLLQNTRTTINDINDTKETALWISAPLQRLISLQKQTVWSLPVRKDINILLEWLIVFDLLCSSHWNIFPYWPRLRPILSPGHRSETPIGQCAPCYDQSLCTWCTFLRRARRRGCIPCARTHSRSHQCRENWGHSRHCMSRPVERNTAHHGQIELETRLQQLWNLNKYFRGILHHPHNQSKFENQSGFHPLLFQPM